MTLKTRTTHNFVELEVDEIKTTMFKGDKEMDTMIQNLADVLDTLLDYSGKSITDYFNIR